MNTPINPKNQWSNQTKNPWTEEIVEKMRRLAASGMTSCDIAQRIGMSRNSVVGKCGRLKILLLSQVNRPKTRTPPFVRPTAPKAPKPQPRLQPKLQFSNAKDPFRQLVSPQELILPASLQLTVGEMDFARQCRFPLVDPCTAEFRYCGAPSHKERVYCEPHCRLSYIGFQS